MPRQRHLTDPWIVIRRAHWGYGAPDSIAELPARPAHRSRSGRRIWLQEGINVPFGIDRPRRPPHAWRSAAPASAAAARRAQQRAGSGPLDPQERDLTGPRPSTLGSPAPQNHGAAARNAAATAGHRLGSARRAALTSAGEATPLGQWRTPGEQPPRLAGAAAASAAAAAHHSSPSSEPSIASAYAASGSRAPPPAPYSSPLPLPPPSASPPPPPPPSPPLPLPSSSLSLPLALPQLLGSSPSGGPGGPTSPENSHCRHSRSTAMSTCARARGGGWEVLRGVPRDSCPCRAPAGGAPPPSAAARGRCPAWPSTRYRHPDNPWTRRNAHSPQQLTSVFVWCALDTLKCLKSPHLVPP